MTQVMPSVIHESTRNAPAWMAGLAGSLLLMTACAAPGMKLNEKPSSQPSTYDIGGQQVTFRRLDPQAIRVPAHSASASLETLGELASEAPRPYTIGPQDVLVVTVWDHPEITLALGQYRNDNATGSLVEEDGYIYFPYVGRIKVSGLTATEARTLLTRDLVKVLQNPQVDVKVLAFRSQKIFVGGEVKTPAIYNVTDVPFTLAEAVNRAGGFTPQADDSRIILTRGNRSWRLNFQTLMAQGGLASRIYLKDGDTLLVPNSLEEPVYMMGELIKPGTLPLVHGNLSLAKAISDAGGIAGASADARSIYVLRQGQAANAVEVFHLDARHPAAMVLADRFALRPHDFVYVDAGTVVRFGKVMNLLLPTYSATMETVLATAEIKYFTK